MKYREAAVALQAAVSSHHARLHPSLGDLAKADPDCLLHLAKHETGHTILAALCGSKVISVTIHTPDEEEWEIHRAFMWSHPNPDMFREAMTTSAGMAGAFIDCDKKQFFDDDDPDDRFFPFYGDADMLEADLTGESGIYDLPVQSHPDFNYVLVANEAYKRSRQLIKKHRAVFDELVALLLAKKSVTAEDLAPTFSKLPRIAPRSSVLRALSKAAA